MSKHISQKELVQSINQNLTALEEGNLSISEVENHFELVRELYERTIVLRYKSFEIKSTLPKEMKEEIIPEKNEVVKERMDGVFEQEKESVNDLEESTDIEPEIVFDFFSSPEPEAEKTLSKEDTTSDITQKLTEEKIVNETSEKEVEEQELVENEKIEKQTESGGLFSQKAFDIEKNMKNQIGFNPINTLVGSFGLNERLLYINELFDGSSEAFSDAIKLLDNKSSLLEATPSIEELALKHNWELDAETFEEFVQKLCRRYA